MIHKKGQQVYCLDHAVAVFDEENTLIRMDGIIVDITIQKQLHEEHLQAEELETLGQISSRLAHELRNPLTAIGGLTKRLLKTFDGEDPRAQKADLIMEQVVKLERILKMILGYLEPQSINLESTNVNMIVTEAVDMVNDNFKDDDLSLRLELDESLHSLRLDRLKFRNCLVQLLENAYYRMQRKGEIKVSTRRVGEHAIVSLVYNAPFISDDDIHDFFYPFMVAFPFKDGEEEGDVVDLPVCKRIIHGHCGIINVSRENETSLWIDIALPLER